jgi:hypothetical protein
MVVNALNELPFFQCRYTHTLEINFFLGEIVKISKSKVFIVLFLTLQLANSLPND